MAQGKKTKGAEELSVWLRFFTALTRFIDKFGIALTLIAMLVFTVWLLGDAKTKNDFVRELLFGEITKGRSLAIFMVALVLIAMFGIDGAVRSRLSESREMKRLADEKSKWQERALKGSKLSHSADARGTE